MKYILIELKNTYMADGKEHQVDGALNCDAYMAINNEGTVLQGYKDLEGNDIILPEKQEILIKDKNCPAPEWGE